MTTLNNLVDQLTRPHTIPIDEAGTTIGHRHQAALLTKLSDARTANIGQGNGTKAAHERSTLNAGAAELYTAIHTRIRTWARNEAVPQHWAEHGILPVDWRDPAALLRAWHTRTLATPRFDPTTYIDTLDSWIRTITDLVVDPPYRTVIDAPCPLCGNAWVAPHDSDGNPISGLAVRTLEQALRTPISNSTVTCRACHKVWHGINGARDLRIALDDHANHANHQVAS